MTYQSQLLTLVSTVSASYTAMYRLMDPQIVSYCQNGGLTKLRSEDIITASRATIRRVFGAEGLPDITIDLEIPLGYDDGRDTTLTISTTRYSSGVTTATKVATGSGTNLTWPGGATISQESVLEQIYNLINGL